MYIYILAHYIHVHVHVNVFVVYTGRDVINGTNM